MADGLLLAAGISIHPLHTEGDLLLCLDELLQYRFQSTPSTRRVTNTGGRNRQRHRDFNPHPPHGG